MSLLEIQDRATQLRQVLSVLSTAAEKLASDWDAVTDSVHVTSTVTQAEFDARKVMLAALGSMESLVQDPHMRLLTLSTSYLISRALHVIAEHDIAGIIAGGGEGGVSILELAERTNIQQDKLCRLMRALASHHVFIEVSEGVFANSRVSAVLADDAAFRAHVIMKGQVHYSASDFLPSTLASRIVGHSSDPKMTAFQQAVGTQLPMFQWLHQTVPESETSWRPAPIRHHPWETDDATKNPETAASVAVSRPQKDLFHLAMAGSGRGFEQYYAQDYPWRELGIEATVVDVGGGIGSFCMQLNNLYPELRCIVQDKGPVIQQAENIWADKNPTAVSKGLVQLNVHDFFEPNPVVGAKVYWLRYILHDWPDDKAIEILSRIRESMDSDSKLLICDIVVNTTLGCDEMESAPEPLLPNYGYATSFAHMMDLNMMMMVNGRERTPTDFRRIAQAADLEIRRIWSCRGPLSIVECCLP